MSMYRLSKISKVPYATLNDICNGKTQLTKCSAETVYRLAQALDIPMEDLLRPFMVRRTSFENFKSTVCHRVMEMGDVEFMMDLLDSNAIRTYYDRHWYPESLYLLAMLDYLSRLHNLPQCSDYDDLRQCKLEKTVYEQVVPHTEAYRKLRREIADLSQELQKELNSEEYGKVEHYRDMLSDSFHLEGVAYFGEGLRLGIGIMAELYGVPSKCETDGADDPGGE